MSNRQVLFCTKPRTQRPNEDPDVLTPDVCVSHHVLNVTVNEFALIQVVVGVTAARTVLTLQSLWDLTIHVSLTGQKLT